MLVSLCAKTKKSVFQGDKIWQLAVEVKCISLLSSNVAFMTHNKNLNESAERSPSTWYVIACAKLVYETVER